MVNFVVFAQIIDIIIVFPFLKDLEDRFLERLLFETHSDVLEASSCDKKPHESTAGLTVRGGWELMRAYRTSAVCAFR